MTNNSILICSPDGIVSLLLNSVGSEVEFSEERPQSFKSTYLTGQDHEFTHLLCPNILEKYTEMNFDSGESGHTCPV